MNDLFKLLFGREPKDPRTNPDPQRAVDALDRAVKRMCGEEEEKKPEDDAPVVL